MASKVTGQQQRRLSSSAIRRAAAACVVCAIALGFCPSAQATITRSGTLHATVADDFRGGESTTRYTLQSGSQETVVRPTELAAEAGDRVVVTGEMRDDRLVGAVKATSESQPILGPHKTAVLLINPGGGGGFPWSEQSARSEVFTAANSASAFYQEESYGEISLTGKLREDGDVFGEFSVSVSTAGCPYSEWLSKANEAATAAGINLSGYQNLIYAMPFQAGCPWSGIAGLDSNWAMINGNFGSGVVAHELGHDLGLLHAGSLTCTSAGVRVQISDNCTSAEYGDPFDVMGSTFVARHNSGWNLAKLNILGPENIETIESSGTYSMRSALHPTTETTVLRIPHERSFDGSVTSWYYLEVREKGGVFENVDDATMTGVSIRIAPNLNLGPETLLLDANPATATFEDAPLAAGETFDAGGPVQIKTLSAGGGKATVSITLDEEAPSAPADLTATGGVNGVQLGWQASSDNLGVDHYLVFRDGSFVGTSPSTSFVDSSAAVGDHEYVVYAEDGNGNRSAASNSAEGTVTPDEEPPTTPTDLTATVGLEGVQLEWEASTDDLGVDHYVVLRGGSQTGTALSDSFLDPLAPAGDLEYVIYAEDAAGNRSDTSEPVSLTVPAVFGPVCAGGTCTDTVRYTGTTTSWTVPPGVQKANFTVEGARGGGIGDSGLTGSGFGAGLEATLGSLTPGAAVTLSLGGVGKTYSEGGEGGFGGGGDGTFGGGGGGFSSVTLGSTLMLLAAGGGGRGANGSNVSAGTQPGGGLGGYGGEVGGAGSNGHLTEALGATLGRGTGGTSGGNGALGGAGGGVSGASTCGGGASAGGDGAAGLSFSGGGDAPGAGAGGGGGYVGGGQGGGGAGDACGDTAGAGGGAGGASYAAPGLSATSSAGVRSGNGQASIAYPNPVKAVTHKYLTRPGQELAVPAASGVLSGVSQPSGIQPSAGVATPPAHGSLTMEADGSFTYTPAPGYSGGDSFKYQATDPSGSYATAQVTLTVAAPPSALISAPAAGNTFEVGQSVSTAFSCSEGAGGSGLLSCTDSAGVKTGSGHLDTSAVGSHVYTVTAVSKDGLTESTSINYTVVPKPELPKRPEDLPGGPAPPAPGIDLSLSIETESLRELLRTQKLDLAVTVNKAASVKLTGSAKLFKGKTVRFAAAGEKDVTLTLTQKGREALRNLSKLRLAIVGNATGGPGEAVKRQVASVLQRERTSRRLLSRSW